MTECFAAFVSENEGKRTKQSAIERRVCVPIVRAGELRWALEAGRGDSACLDEGMRSKVGDGGEGKCRRSRKVEPVGR